MAFASRERDSVGAKDPSMPPNSSVTGAFVPPVQGEGRSG
jgi:hypothetical protein